MRRIVTTAAATLFAATLAVPVYGQANEGAGQQVEPLKQQRQQEAEAQGNRKIEVSEMAAWGLGELPPNLMTKAAEKLGSDPDAAKLSVMQAANILEIQASVDADTPESRRLMESADDLREVARKIEYRQLLNKDELREPFARAALAGAACYQAAAERGLEQNDEEKTGYSLKGAGAYLIAAHAFAEKQPSAEASAAAYNAGVLAKQIVSASKGTTYNAADGRDSQTAQAGQNGADAQGDADRAQPAAARQGGRQDQANIPDEARQAVQDLGAAIEQATAAIGG